MSDPLSSAQNPLIKALKRLRESPARLRKEGLVWVEGPRWTALALKAGWQPKHLVLAEEQLLKRQEGERYLDAFKDFDPVRVVPSLFTRLAESPAPQGVIGLFHRPAEAPEPAQGLVLGLHGVQDPGNVGTLLRSAAAFGAAGVVLFGPCADPFGIKAVRASAGACFSLPVWQGTEPETFAGGAFSLWALDPKGEALLPGKEPQGPTLLLVGAERGLPAEVIQAADLVLKIPMAEGSESLNAAMAGTAALALLQADRL